MATQLICSAPAKLNLFLHITGRRADGYHDLQTIFQLIDFSDTLAFKLRDDNQIQLTPYFENIPQQQNLIYRAAKLLQQTTNSEYGIDIHLDKRIPLGAGLGGGSSNAATTLIALNYLWDLKFSLAELAALGLRLGADVPIFVHGLSAWAEGVGEQIWPIELPNAWYLVITPNCHVSTAKIFSDLSLTRNTPPSKIRTFLPEGLHNDCEAVVRYHYPAVAQALDWLNKLAPARLTGSGSSIFAAFATESEAENIALQIPTTWNYFIAQGLANSPLHTSAYQAGWLK